MEYKNITNKEFLKMCKEFDNEDGEKLTYLIANDKNENNQKAYNTIIRTYYSYCEKEIHMHGSWYEPTGVTLVLGTLPRPISYKISKIYEKIRNEKKLEDVKNSLKKDPEAKAIYDKLEL